MKRQTVITPERVESEIRMRSNSLTNLTPQALSSMLDSFGRGYLQQASRTWQTMEEKDDILSTVLPKRKDDVSLLEWEILPEEGADPAMVERHTKALNYFYGHLTATHALEGNLRGGLSKFVEHMMDAVAKRYSVHELIFQPVQVNGEWMLTAEMKFVPLWFFESLSGQLRFLPQPMVMFGVPMAADEWFVHMGRGLMVAASIAYLFKVYPLRDLLIYCQRYGLPAVIGKTKAKPGSPEWEAMKAAVAAIASGFQGVCNDSDVIEIVTLAVTGNLPQSQLVERMDRALTRLVRGADLATMSAADHAGASLQGDETDAIQVADARAVSEAMWNLDRQVTLYLFGEEPCVYFQLQVQEKQNVDRDLKVDTFILESGGELPLEETYARYGRRKPKAGEAVLRKQAPAPSFPGQGGGVPSQDPALSNSNSRPVRVVPLNPLMEQLQAETRERMARAQIADLQPIFERAAALLNIADPEARKAAAREFLADLPGLHQALLKNPKAAEVLHQASNAAFINGLTERLTKLAA